MICLLRIGADLWDWAHKRFGWGPCEYPPTTYDYADAPRRCDVCGRPE